MSCLPGAPVKCLLPLSVMVGADHVKTQLQASLNVSSFPQLPFVNRVGVHLPGSPQASGVASP